MNLRLLNYQIDNVKNFIKNRAEFNGIERQLDVRYYTFNLINAV